MKDIYENGEHNWRILWILLYFDVEMSKNKSLKLLRIKEQFNRGMRSPALLLEACLILNEQPLLLRVMNDFEIHVLLYGCKEGIVEERLLEQAAGLALNCDGKQRLLFRLLTGMYRLSENDEVLEAICGILIRNGMKGTRYILGSFLSSAKPTKYELSSVTSYTISFAIKFISIFHLF